MSRRTFLELSIATRLSRGPTGDCMLLECLRVVACQCKIFQLSIARSFVLFSSTRVSICQLTSVFVKCLREYSEKCVRHYSAFYVIQSGIASDCLPSLQERRESAWIRFISKLLLATLCMRLFQVGPCLGNAHTILEGIPTLQPNKPTPTVLHSLSHANMPPI